MKSGFWTDRPTLVTGATGLLGSAMVRRLAALGADVVCLVRDFAPGSEMHRSGVGASVKQVRGDICDQATMERTLGEYEIDTVLHLAAQTIVGVANRNPLSTFESNIAGTWVTLEACRRTPTVKQIVLASSDKAYGDHEILPYDETTPLIGRHPYDVSKSCADLIAQAYAHTYGLPVCVTRCGNFYGGGDLNWNRIVPGTIRSVLRGERPIIRSDGKAIRDYLYMEDGVTAYLAVVEALAARPELVGQAFNFGHNAQVTVLDVVEQILALSGRDDLTPDIRNEAKNEIAHQYLDAAKAHRELGWEPEYTLESGLRDTFAWYKNYLGAAS